MKSMFKKMTTLALTGAIMASINVCTYANQMVDIDLWNAVSDKASMGNVATDNNSLALYNSSKNTLQIALNPVNISGYMSGVTAILYDTSGSGSFKEVSILETNTIESGTRNDGQNHTVEYIQVLEMEVPSYLTKSGVEFVDIQMKVPHTPMDTVMADGYLDARIRIDWSNIAETDDEKLVADSTMSGGEISGISLQDKNSGVRIIGDSSQVSADAELYVEIITSGANFDKAKTALGTSDFNLYDIRLAVDGAEVGMMGAAEIRVPYNGEVEIYRISDDSKKTLLRGTGAGQEYSFLTNQVGLIAVIGGEKQSISLVDGATDNGALNGGSSTSTGTSGNPFTDIDPHWAKDNILYAVEKGLFSGVTPTTFEPNSNMTGAMVISVLHRMAGSPSAQSSDSAWYGEAVAWGKANDIIGGYKDFVPTADVTREEFATMLYRFEKSKTTTVAGADLSKFTDSNQISSWAKDGLAWANAVGIVSGVTETTIAPSNSATRAVIATMLCNYVDM